MEMFSSLPTSIIAGLAVLLLIRYVYERASYRRHKIFYPPGPQPLPLIGNLLDMPKTRDWEVYKQWGERYGEIVHAQSLGRSFVVLNSYKAVSDLFESRSSLYSDRPYLVMVHDLIKYFGTGSQRYGNSWRKHRKLYRKHMDPSVISQYQAAEALAGQEFLKRLKTSPRDYQAHARFITANLVLGISYGLSVQNKFEEYAVLNEEQGRLFTSAVRPGAFLVELIPWLKYVPAWMPGAQFKRLAARAREVMRLANHIPFNDVKAELAKGNNRPSFVTSSLTDLGTVDESQYEDLKAISEVAGSIFLAGADTTSATIEWFLLAMTLYPDVQKKAQNELDEVVGRGRLPQFSDRDELPYINAVVKELFRRFPVTRTGLPHCATKDDVYEGYFIPKNTTVIGNVWALLTNPIEYPDPFTFMPERFLPRPGEKVARDPLSGGAFGFGRRICPGRHLADASMFIIVAYVLSCFEISKAVDENGSTIDVMYATEPAPGFFSRPPFFPFNIKPRSGVMADLAK